MKRVFLICVSVCLLIFFLGEGLYAQSHYSTSQSQENYDKGIQFERVAGQSNSVDDWKKAAEAYKAALSQDSNMVKAAARLGYVYYVLKQSEEGINMLRGVLKRHPEDLELQHTLGLNLYQHGDVDEAERVLSSVVSSRNDLADAYFILGMIYLDKKKYDESKASFRQYVELVPTDVQGYRALSRVTILQRDIEGSAESLTKLLELEPNDYVANLNMGHISFEQGAYDESLKYYEKASQLDPKKSKEINYLKASVLYLSGRYEKAQKHFEAMLVLNPKSFEARYYIADCLLKRGELKLAEESFVSLLEEYPKYYYARLKLAELSLSKGDKGYAKDLIEEVMGLSQDVDVQLYAGVLYRRMGDIAKALEIHRRLVDSNPLEVKYKLHLVQDHWALGAYDEAVAILEQIVLETQGSNSLVWSMLSASLLYQGNQALLRRDLSLAQERFTRAMEMEVHPVESRCNLARIALINGQRKEAETLYQEAKALEEGHPNVLKLDAEMQLQAKQYSQAEKSLLKLESENKEAFDVGARYLLGVAQANLGRWDLAVENFEKALEGGLEDAGLKAVVGLQKGISLVEKGDNAGAEKYFAEAYANRDYLDELDSIRLDYLISMSMIRAKRFSQAQELLKKLQGRFNQLSPSQRSSIVSGGQLDVDYQLAYVYLESGNYNAALDLISGKRGGIYQDLEASVRRNLALKAYQSKNYNGAYEHLEKVMRSGRSDGGDQVNMAVVQDALGRGNPGNIFERYANQNIPAAVLNYGIYLDNIGNQAEAIPFYQRYVRLVGDRKATEVKNALEVKERVWGNSKQ